MDKRLLDIQKEINDLHPHVKAYNRDEYIEAFKEFEDMSDLIEGEYLMITDDTSIIDHDNDLIIGCCYSVDIDEERNDLIAIWQCYPEDPIYGHKDIVQKIQNCINTWEQHKKEQQEEEEE